MVTRNGPDPLSEQESRAPLAESQPESVHGTRSCNVYLANADTRQGGADDPVPPRGVAGWLWPRDFVVRLWDGTTWKPAFSHAELLPEWFGQAWRLLRPGGSLLNQGITMNIRERLPTRPTFAQQYNFPEGELVPLHQAVRAEEVGFEVRDVESLREHYVLTLSEWLHRLEASRGGLPGDRRTDLPCVAALPRRDRGTLPEWFLQPLPGADGQAGSRTKWAAVEPGGLVRLNRALATGLFDTKRRLKMRLLGVIGCVLVVLGIVALAIPTFTFFTTERVADVGFFKIDVSRPHTIVLNPIVGGVALAAGIVLILVGRRSTSS
jgi:hypothetical protein